MNEGGEKRPGPTGAVYAAKGTFPGDVNLQWDAVKGARKYVLQMSSKKNKKWVQIDIVIEPYYMLTGLDDKNEYKFRVAAVLPEGQIGWSDVVVKKI